MQAPYLSDSTGNPVFLWLVNHVELPLANLLMHKGDVRIYSRKELTEMCRQSGLVMEAFENSGVWHLHAVIRKPRGCAAPASGDPGWAGPGLERPRPRATSTWGDPSRKPL